MRPSEPGVKARDHHNDHHDDDSVWQLEHHHHDDDHVHAGLPDHDGADHELERPSRELNDNHVVFTNLNLNFILRLDLDLDVNLDLRVADCHRADAARARSAPEALHPYAHDEHDLDHDHDALVQDDAHDLASDADADDHNGQRVGGQPVFVCVAGGGADGGAEFLYR